jgi:hypothetical protein
MPGALQQVEARPRRPTNTNRASTSTGVPPTSCGRLIFQVPFLALAEAGDPVLEA